MPYILVKYEEDALKKRTVVGDAESDPELMQFLHAEQRPSGATIKYVTMINPRVVLNLLETRGYRVITCTSKGDHKLEGFILWTLHRTDGPPAYGPTLSSLPQQQPYTYPQQPPTYPQQQQQQQFNRSPQQPGSRSQSSGDLPPYTSSMATPGQALPLPPKQ